MSKKNQLLVANWKLNPVSFSDASQLAKKVIKAATYIRGLDIVLCPSIMQAGLIKKDYRGKKVKFGTQDISIYVDGAYTGSVSAKQLNDLGFEYVIIGHSERRYPADEIDCPESNHLVAKKVSVAINNNLTPIVCIGEKNRNPDGHYLQDIRTQLYESLSSIDTKHLSKLVIAYEPIWAIGQTAKKAITGHDLHEMYLYIQKLLTERWGSSAAKKVTIIYGGSVKPENVKILSKEGMMDGFLVGSASLNANSFIQIAKSM